MSRVFDFVFVPKVGSQEIEDRLIKTLHENARRAVEENNMPATPVIEPKVPVLPGAPRAPGAPGVPGVPGVPAPAYQPNIHRPMSWTASLQGYEQERLPGYEDFDDGIELPAYRRGNEAAVDIRIEVVEVDRVEEEEAGLIWLGAVDEEGGA